MRFKLYALLFCFGSIVTLIGYTGYHQFYLSGLQGEAKLMFSYLHTLQKVHHQEHGTYIAFDNYGAAQRGQDRCSQPEEAARLGFLIPGCHRKGAAYPRYTYRSRVDAKGEHYSLEAESGSDSEGRSFICFDTDGNEFWESR